MRDFLNRIRPGLIYALAILLGSSLQFNSQLFSFDIRPDFLLVFPLLAGMRYGPRDGMIIGLICGFFRDYFAGRYFGLGLFVTFLLAWGSGFLPVIRGRLRYVLYAAVIIFTTIFLRFGRAVFSFFAQAEGADNLSFFWFVREMSSDLPLMILMNLIIAAVIVGLHFVLPLYPRAKKSRSGVMINFEPGGPDA
jgi:rod shape-determining protein MreD